MRLSIFKMSKFGEIRNGRSLFCRAERVEIHVAIRFFPLFWIINRGPIGSQAENLDETEQQGSQ